MCKDAVLSCVDTGKLRCFGIAADGAFIFTDSGEIEYIKADCQHNQEHDHLQRPVISCRKLRRDIHHGRSRHRLKDAAHDKVHAQRGDEHRNAEPHAQAAGQKTGEQACCNRCNQCQRRRAAGTQQQDNNQRTDSLQCAD